jgi:hypothetical protein
MTAKLNKISLGYQPCQLVKRDRRFLTVQPGALPFLLDLSITEIDWTQVG